MKLMPRSERNARLRELLVPALFCLLAVIVFATQFAGTGFGERHYGWVSSHGLSIASRATPVNGFVGHARTILNTDGTLDYVYFDRYPIFYSALLGALISLTEDLTLKVWIARQVMLALFVLAMLLAWRLLRRLSAPPVALTAVTLGFSGYMLLYYREMVHFDQPALLGMLLLLYIIARVKLECRERWRWLTIVTLVVLGLGRSFVSLSVLGLWTAFEAAGLLWQRERPLWQTLARHPRARRDAHAAAGRGLDPAHDGLQTSRMRWRAREVPLEQTSLVNSLQRRLPGAALAAQDRGCR